MDKLHYLFFAIAVIGAFLGTMGVIAGQTNFNNNENLTEVINGILELQQIQLETDENIILILKSTDYNLSELGNQTNDKFNIFQNEIVKIKTDIKNKFPQASQVVQQEQSSIASTPFLTLEMDQTEFLLGEIIRFNGVASPTHAVIITVKLADRTLESVAVSKSEIINGEYTAEFQTRFDDPKGTWQVYARQSDDQTKTLTFKVE